MLLCRFFLYVITDKIKKGSLLLLLRLFNGWLFTARSIVISVSVCMSVCLSVRSHISKTTRPSFTNFTLHIVCGLIWRQCDMLCTSGFVDDVMSSYNKGNGQNQRRRVCFVEFARWRHWGNVCRLRLHSVVFSFRRCGMLHRSRWNLVNFNHRQSALYAKFQLTRSMRI